MSRFHDVNFVAQRTEVVTRLIWYPPIVLAVMLVAQSSFFDNWTFPLGLVLVFVLSTLGSAVIGAMLLRRSAERLRGWALSNLRTLRQRNYPNKMKRKMLSEMIAEVRALKKGAFAPLSDQPFIRAILYPSGGLGLLAVAQRLLDVF